MQTVVLAHIPNSSWRNLFFDSNGECEVSSDVWVAIHVEASRDGLQVVSVNGANMGIGRMVLDNATSRNM